MTKESLTGGGIEIADLGRVVGLSAYELAVKQGYEGSLDEWLESLKYVSSEEYKELAKQVEVSAVVIEEALKKANTKVQEITNLTDQSLQAVTTAKNRSCQCSKRCPDNSDWRGTAGTEHGGTKHRKEEKRILTGSGDSFV